MQRKWIEDLDSWNGFSYLRLKGVPMRKSINGGVIGIDEAKLERFVAVEILKNPVPIFGKELSLFRKVTGLSLNKFGQRLGVTSGAVFYWEKAAKQKLGPMIAVAVRTLCAEELGVELHLSYSSMVGYNHHDPVDVIISGRKPNKKRYKTKTVLKPSYRGDRKIKVRVQM